MFSCIFILVAVIRIEEGVCPVRSSTHTGRSAIPSAAATRSIDLSLDRYPPARNARELTPAFAASIRPTRARSLISNDITRTPVPCSAKCCARLMSITVFPTPGLAATIVNSPG